MVESILNLWLFHWLEQHEIMPSNTCVHLDRTAQFFGLCEPNYYLAYTQLTIINYFSTLPSLTLRPQTTWCISFPIINASTSSTPSVSSYSSPPTTVLPPSRITYGGLPQGSSFNPTLFNIYLHVTCRPYTFRLYDFLNSWSCTRLIELQWSLPERHHVLWTFYLCIS